MTDINVVIAVIAIGVALMVGYLVIAQVTDALPVTDTATNTSIQSTKTTVFAGFGLLGVGIIVVAAFSLIRVFTPNA
jgi:hypothetical protein